MKIKTLCRVAYFAMAIAVAGSAYCLYNYVYAEGVWAVWYGVCFVINAGFVGVGFYNFSKIRSVKKIQQELRNEGYTEEWIERATNGELTDEDIKKAVNDKR